MARRYRQRFREEQDRIKYIGIDGEGEGRELLHRINGRLLGRADILPDTGDGPKFLYNKVIYDSHRDAALANARDLGVIHLDPDNWWEQNHRYIILAAAREDSSENWVAKADEGGRLKTEDCLDLILELPKNKTRIFAYSFQYDITKMLTDVDNEALYYLLRPNLRQRLQKPELGPWAVRWCRCHPGRMEYRNSCPDGKDYWLNLQGTKFTVSKYSENESNRTIIWDLFRFYGCRYVQALKNWKIGTDKFIEEMTLMKDKRAIFDTVPMQEKITYCLNECSTMGELGHKLVKAHNEVGLSLRSFYGAGSSGAAMLKAMDIKDKSAVNWPDEMMAAVAAAFAGGRFENSLIGTVLDKIYGLDISSAYPYQIYYLPCLLHGKWVLTKDPKEVLDSRTALVRYAMPVVANSRITSWAPFPFRLPSGSICYPQSSGGGWVWKDEFVAGKMMYPDEVKFLEAWVYKCECNCKPFSKIAEYYIMRLKLGKEGAGIVAKNGVNSCYGKLAQSVGNAPFNNWVWAGLITSGCRAQVLEVMALHKDVSNVLMVATDGIYTKEEVTAPIPKITGTNIEVLDVETGEMKRKPLGGWEGKTHDKGVFIARPGIYFPLDPTPKDLKEIRARGLGKGIVLENWKKIVDSYEKNGVGKTVEIANVDRFCGAKTCISRSEAGYYRANYPYGTGKPAFGQWIARKVEMSFNPMPKRKSVRPDGTLELRVMDQGKMSAPYKKALEGKTRVITEEVAEELIEIFKAKMEIYEQPDGDLTDYGLHSAQDCDA